MDHDLELLLPLASLDTTKLARLDDLRRARQRLEADGRAVDDAQAHLDEVNAALATLRKEERHHDDELRRLAGLKSSAENALAQGHGDPAGAERQIQRCNDLIDEHETAQLELYERRDTLESQHDEAAIALETAQAALTADRERLEPNIDAWNRAIADIETERATHRAALAADIRSQYDDLVARKKFALAALSGDACTACHTVVPLQRGADVRQGRMVMCSGCARWLYAPGIADPAPTT